MAFNRKINSSYGLSGPLVNVFPDPIIATRAPLISDKAPIGTRWIDTAANIVYTLTSVSSGAASWVRPFSSNGVFDSITATIGNITADLGDIVATAGDIIVTAGDIVVSAGSVDVTDGDVNVLSGDVNVALGDVEILEGNVEVANGNISAGRTSADTTPPIIFFNKDRVGLKVEPGDFISEMVFNGFDGSSFVKAASIRTEVVGATSSGVIPSEMQFFTTDGIGVLHKSLTIESLGNVEIEGSLIISTAAKGIVFDPGGNGTKIIEGAGSPNTVITAPKGSLYLRIDGTSTTTRAYINTDGSTAWTAIITVA